MKGYNMTYTPDNDEIDHAMQFLGTESRAKARQWLIDMADDEQAAYEKAYSESLTPPGIGGYTPR
jgi:hypothetical protein